MFYLAIVRHPQCDREYIRDANTVRGLKRKITNEFASGWNVRIEVADTHETVARYVTK